MDLGTEGLRSIEVGQLYFRLCAFDQAIRLLETSLAEAEKTENWEDFGHFLTLLIRIRAERMEFEQIDVWLPKIASIPEEKQPSSISYVQGIVAAYRGQQEEARNFFKKSIQQSKADRDRQQATFGLATVATMAGDFSGAEIITHQLEAELRDTIFVDLQAACLILRAVVLRKQRRFDEALAALIQSQRLCQRDSNFFMALNTLYGMGCVYMDKGDLQRGDDYFEILQNLMNPVLRHLASQLQQRRAELTNKRSSGQSLKLVEGGERALVLPDGQRVDLGKQFVLLNLLKLFGEDPGKSISKEDIVRKVWKEDYHPLRHDNKIHATILRLRRLIEKDAKHPVFILNTEDGYCMSAKLSFDIIEEQVAL